MLLFYTDNKGESAMKQGVCTVVHIGDGMVTVNVLYKGEVEERENQCYFQDFVDCEPKVGSSYKIVVDGDSVAITDDPDYVQEMEKLPSQEDLSRWADKFGTGSRRSRSGSKWTPPKRRKRLF